MSTISWTKTPVTMAFALLLAIPVACGGDDEGGDSDGESSSSSGSSQQTCESSHTCVGGSCECTTSGKSGTGCCDPNSCGTDDADNCEAKCEVCS